ncbi:hypothetical protein M404DRAFT_1002037, partial [Pisolithus tinctorius Marx 270]
MVARSEAKTRQQRRNFQGHSVAVRLSQLRTCVRELTTLTSPSVVHPRVSDLRGQMASIS